MRLLTHSLFVGLLVIITSVGMVRLEPAAAISLSDITLPDANLQACVTRTAVANGWTDSEEVVELVCEQAHIFDLSGIHQFANLTRLRLRNNRISDIRPLASLVNLTTLDLGGDRSLPNNRISDLRPLAGLTALTTLDLSNNRVLDVRDRLKVAI